jgi:hypothetical protein
LSLSAEMPLRLPWTCRSETNCLNQEPELTALVRVGCASREGVQAYATEGGWGCCCCCVLLHSIAAKASPGMVWLEENTLPLVVFLFRVSSLACLQPRQSEGWGSSPSTNLQLLHVSINALLLFSGHSFCRWPSPHHIQRGGPLAVSPDMAELLAAVTLRETSLGFVRLHPDCNMAKAPQCEYLMGRWRPKLLGY